MRVQGRAGFTLIETLVSLVLFALVLGGLFTASQRGLSLFRVSSANGDVTGRSARAMNRIVGEILPAGLATLAPDLETPPGADTVWSPNLEFRIADDYAADAVVWGGTRRIAWELAGGELDNGVDDDGDGLVDEGVVVLIRNLGAANEQRAVLVHGVAEYLEGETPNGADDNGNGLVDERGLVFDLAGDTLNVRLTLERVLTDGGRILRTHTCSIALRN